MNKVFFLDVEDSTHYFLQSIICPNKAVYKYMNDNSIPITIKTLLFGSEKLTLQKTYFYLIKCNPLSKQRSDSSNPCKHVCCSPSSSYSSVCLCDQFWFFFQFFFSFPNYFFSNSSVLFHFLILFFFFGCCTSFQYY